MESFAPYLGVLIAAALAILFLRSRSHPSAPGVVAAPPGQAAAASPSVQDLLQAGRKIDAIKAYRAEHGVGLREAKDAVDALARGLPR